jgi:hypothetical protein
MAAYQFLTSEATIQVLSPDLVRDAQRITARASASQVVYSLVFAPYPTDPQGTIIWTDSLIADQLSYWAGIWDTNSMVRGVAGISLTQTVDATGQLQDVALVVVTSTSGNSTAQLTLPPRQWLPSVAGTTLTKSFPDSVAEAVGQLDAVEASGATAPSEVTA